MMAGSIQEGTAAATVDAPVEQWIADLSGDSFSCRVSAQRSLAEIADRIPERLEEAALPADSEQALRIVRLLEGVFLDCADERGDRAERALERLSHSSSAAALVAGQVLDGNARLREARARKAIERLGGELGYVHPAEQPGGWRQIGPGFANGPYFGPPAVLYSVLISEDWLGKAEDLWHVRRLSHHPDLTLYNIRGSGLTYEDLMPLVREMPGLTIVERGACLGISGSPGFGDGTGATVLAVVRGSAADRANLMVNDRILALDDKPVMSFQSLVELLLEYSPNTKVELSIRREDQLLTVPVTLSSWKGQSHSGGIHVPAPPPFHGPLGTAVPPPPSMPEPIPPVYEQSVFAR